jgi:predicted nucleic acid-binding protein
LIIIDTDALIEIMDKKSKKGECIVEKMEKSHEIFAITSITLYETFYFFMKKEKNISPIPLFRVYGFSRESAQKAAELEIGLEKKGKRIKRTNIMIAAIVINEGATLCTLEHDFNELQDQGLKLFLDI